MIAQLIYIIFIAEDKMYNNIKVQSIIFHLELLQQWSWQFTLMTEVNDLYRVSAINYSPATPSNTFCHTVTARKIVFTVYCLSRRQSIDKMY